MKKGIKKLLVILIIILAVGFIVFLCQETIVNTVFYNMDTQMDLPKDLKTNPKYAPDSKSER